MATKKKPAKKSTSKKASTKKKKASTTKKKASTKKKTASTKKKKASTKKASKKSTKASTKKRPAKASPFVAEFQAALDQHAAALTAAFVSLFAKLPPRLPEKKDDNPIGICVVYSLDAYQVAVCGVDVGFMPVTALVPIAGLPPRLWSLALAQRLADVVDAADAARDGDGDVIADAVDAGCEAAFIAWADGCWQRATNSVAVAPYFGYLCVVGEHYIVSLPGATARPITEVRKALAKWAKSAGKTHAR